MKNSIARTLILSQSQFTFNRCYFSSLNHTSRAQCYVSKSTDPFVNLAFEEWLFRKTDPSVYILVLWQDRDCVVIGRNQNPWKEANIKVMKELGVSLVRRKSGGGTVFHDMGNSNYSVILPRNEFHRDKNAFLVSRALHSLDIPARVNERHDIVVSGSAYKLINSRAYHHGTMLIDTNLDKLHKVLHVPYAQEITTKGVASVKSKVKNLCDFSSPKISHLSFCESVQREFAREYNFNIDIEINTIDDNIIHDLQYVKEVHEELQSWEWIYGQTPHFTHDIRNNTSLVHIESRRGIIERVDFNPPDPDLSASLVGIPYNPDIEKKLTNK